MPEFLSLIPPEVALEKFLLAVQKDFLEHEWVDTGAALGRVTACPVFAGESLPAFSRSTVDGFAVRAADTYGASESLPAYLTISGEVRMGFQSEGVLKSGEAWIIHTGGMLPEGADAVVMLEYTQSSRSSEIEIMRAAACGDNIILAGEDVRPGDEVISKGKRLGPADLGGLRALGLQKVCVYRKPRVGLVSSGDEVVAPDQVPGPGQVRDINTTTLAALIEQKGGLPVAYGIASDQLEDIVRLLRTAWEECDIAVINAGSSASVRDLTAIAIRTLGEPGVLVHGVSVRPGKPTILAVCGGKPVIGLPGNPVSALVIAGLFLAPLLDYITCQKVERKGPAIQARLTANIPSLAGREDWFPVVLNHTLDGWTAEPIYFKSNLIFTLAKADGLAYIPPDANGMAAGSDVQVYRLF